MPPTNLNQTTIHPLPTNHTHRHPAYTTVGMGVAMEVAMDGKKGGKPHTRNMYRYHVQRTAKHTIYTYRKDERYRQIEIKWRLTHIYR